ncbi:methylated-DNA--[protein]-cysteine S-methyltransferase [Tessaracoccus caeni]|uniref:methylated-DNA--[protein]-cysteine S-methyltransferase n=1 Tax=Tessaracoccus caeni TaxID=3031239 RepID=UPI0023DBFBE1|nr:methylated-DNA--[protein]-cysteine S-methyltransferase [Tessaracoccus caeni]MDF1489346.1 methylated-DNA--[protein]-cysteine S-methyltransferase [Tessaracoccus caeni]
MKHSITDSPVGPLILVEHDGALVGLYLENQRHFPTTSLGERVDDAMPAAREQLEEYFAGQRRTFDLPLAPVGTTFQQSVWAFLQEIPYGETTTYGALALQLGKPQASRAVGAATGRNRVSIIIPCHRLVGSTGSLTGYAGGVERKQYLLALEQGLVAPEVGDLT